MKKHIIGNKKIDTDKPLEITYNNKLLVFRSNNTPNQTKFSYYITQKLYEDLEEDLPDSGLYKFVIIGYIRRSIDKKYLNFFLLSNDSQNLQFIKINR